MSSEYLNLRVVGSDLELGHFGTEPVEWLEHTFPKSFVTALLLEDRRENSSKVWAIRFEVVFDTEPVVNPTIRDVAIRGLFSRDSWGSVVSERTNAKGKTELRRLNFVAPFAWNQLTTNPNEPVQVWQFRFVERNLDDLCRAAFELALLHLKPTRSKKYPEVVVWGIGSGAWSKRPPANLKTFARRFNKWQSKRVVNPSLLVEVAREYLREVENPKDGRTPKPVLHLMDFYDRPRSTISDWVRQATEAGLLPKPEPRKVRKPAKQRGKQ